MFYQTREIEYRQTSCTTIPPDSYVLFSLRLNVHFIFKTVCKILFKSVLVNFYKIHNGIAFSSEMK